MPDDSDFAFPHVFEEHGLNIVHQGLTARQHAAIQLRVPDSGIDWLDEMIDKARRDEFAAKAMQAWVNGCINSSLSWLPAEAATDAYNIADAMLKEREE